MALAVKGDVRQTDFKTLALYSVLYGILFTIALAAMALVSSVVALIYTLWQMGEPMSLDALKEVGERVPLGFAFLVVGRNLILVYVLIAAGYSAMAVPLASAARAAGQGAPSRGFLYGFGRSFLPLFCIFVVAILVEFFFEF